VGVADAVRSGDWRRLQTGWAEEMVGELWVEPLKARREPREQPFLLLLLLHC
jgi:hypothetical protein